MGKLNHRPTAHSKMLKDTRKVAMSRIHEAPYGNPNLRKLYLPLAIAAICSQWSRFQ